jgi:mannose-1-phosphate guanylyltransferase/mannose-6-phosphate isomerase
VPAAKRSSGAIHPVILSGGSGARLWPISRRAHPKPFMRLLDGETMAEKTFRRALRLAGDGPVMTVTSRDHFFHTRDLYRGVDEDVTRHPFLLEPVGRNTAPAIALAAHEIKARAGARAVMLVMPADHLVRDEEAFLAAAEEAAGLAVRGHLVTFGVHPTHPETGYGYVKRGPRLVDSKGYEVAAFVEKPDLATARRYLESGDHDWNSGMFCFMADSFLEALERFAPDVAEATASCFAEMQRDRYPLEIPAESFARCPSISIDYAVMERADNCAVVAGDFGWSDIGTWRAMAELYEVDEAGNSILGKAVVVESRDCFIQGEERLVAAVGVKNLVIVDTGDAVLVADRDKAQDVKAVVDQLLEREHEAAVYHKTVHRPWGQYSVLDDRPDCKVRRLRVKPGQVLSLQLHEKRSEHWTVLSGNAKARVGEREISMGPGDTVVIPPGTRHRLENTGPTELQLVEVQVGEYIGADDIVRFEDVYGTSEKES